MSQPVNTDDSQLGQELFTKTAGSLERFMAVKFLLIGVIGAICVFAGVGPLAVYTLVPRIILGVLVSLVGLLGLAFLNQMRHSYHLYSNGVRFGSNAMSFDEIESYSFTIKPPNPNYPNLPTAIEVVFTPFPETGKKPIRYNCGGDNQFVKTYMSALENLAVKIGLGMQVAIEDGRRVEWLPKLTFTPSGLEKMPADGFPVTVPYEYLEAGQGWLLDQSKPIELRDVRSDEVITKLPVGAKNLKPGILLIRQLGSPSSV